MSFAPEIQMHISSFIELDKDIKCIPNKNIVKRQLYIRKGIREHEKSKKHMYELNLICKIMYNDYNKYTTPSSMVYIVGRYI